MKNKLHNPNRLLVLPAQAAMHRNHQKLIGYGYIDNFLLAKSIKAFAIANWL